MPKKRQIDYTKYIGSDFSALSKSEKIAVSLAIAGFSNDEIMAIMEIDRRNLGVKLNHALKKLGNPNFNHEIYERDKEKMREAQKKWLEKKRQQDPDYTARYQRRRYAENPDRQKEYDRRYKKKKRNPDFENGEGVKI